MASKRIKDWATNITAFRTGDVIPVDGPDGTAKMSKDDLLKETAQNALAGNVAPVFDPERTSENPYKAGESVIYEGKPYTFKVDHYGAWAAGDVYLNPATNFLTEKTLFNKVTLIKKNYTELSYTYGHYYGNVRNSTTILSFLSSGTWDSYLVDATDVKQVIDTRVGGYQYKTTIVFLSSSTVAVENVISFRYVAVDGPVSYDVVDVPEGCKYILISSLKAQLATPVMNFNLQDSMNNVENKIKDINTRTIDNLLYIQTQADFVMTRPGAFVNFSTASGYPPVAVGTSGTWYSWIVPIDKMKQFVSAKLGRPTRQYSNIMFFDSLTFTQEHLVDFVRAYEKTGEEVTYSASDVVVPSGAQYVVFSSYYTSSDSPTFSIKSLFEPEEQKTTNDALSSGVSENKKNVSFVNKGSFGKDYKVGEYPDSHNVTMKVGQDSTFFISGGVEYRVTFAASSGDNFANFYLEAFENGYETTTTFNRTLKHKFGHCSVVDYSQINDCLILGTGGDTVETEKIFIIPNFSSLVLNTTRNQEFTWSNTPHVEIEFTGRGAGVKPVWGEKNIYRQDVIYVITNDNADVYRVLLGTGTTELDEGTYTAAGDGEFNGTFKVLDHYHQDGCSASTVAQGGQFYDGRLVVGVGYSGIRLWAMSFRADGSIRTEEFIQQMYNNVGTPVHSTNGVAFDSEGRAIIGIMMFTGSDNRNIIYEKHQLGQKDVKDISLLKGKKIAVIGDSISTISGGNTPYWTIKDVDVGNEIEAYVSWFDIYTSATDTTQVTNKTIGGVTLTAAMIGTKQTFMPAAGDVGKTIGDAYNYNSSSVKTWSQVLAEKTGATLIANASFSGASMCDGQASYLANTHGFSPYTIGRCRVRDDAGNFVNPDVIFIYRGTNDMTHGQGGQGYSVLDDYSLMENGYPLTDVNASGKYSFRRAYYMTIKALREAYPKAMIYCCTLNVFKRIVYDRYPTRNGLYSLPMMNKVIREIAAEMGCGLVDFERDGITFENCYSEGYITDSATTPTHPNNKGHGVMGERATVDAVFIN